MKKQAKNQKIPTVTKKFVKAIRLVDNIRKYEYLK